MTCTSPCSISGLDPGTEYQFTVIPNNNCGSPTGCTGNTATAQTACECDMYLYMSICAFIGRIYKQQYSEGEVDCIVYLPAYVPEFNLDMVCAFLWFLVLLDYNATSLTQI